MTFVSDVDYLDHDLGRGAYLRERRATERLGNSASEPPASGSVSRSLAALAIGTSATCNRLYVRHTTYTASQLEQ